MASPAVPVSLYQDSISQSLNAVIEQRTPQMPMLKQATSKTTPKKTKAKRKAKVKQEPVVKKEVNDWSAFEFSAVGAGEVPGECDIPIKKLKQEKITDHLPKVKKKRDRFNGMPEEEVALRLLPDHLAENLDIVIVGINPGLFAAYVGHHYAGPGNHFWKCVYLSGLIPEPMNAYDDSKLLEYGIGFTNICARTTRGSADLKRPEIKQGGEILKEKLQRYKPKIAAFNGKGIYEIFCGHKKFSIGKQPEKLEGTDTIVYVMPSSSARCAQLPRAVDKVPFYEALKKLRDYVKGDRMEPDDSEVTFPKLELKIKKEEPTDAGFEAALQGTSQIKQEPKAKPKKKRNRKSAEATVTSNTTANTLANQEYSGEVSQPYAGEVANPYSIPSQSEVNVPQIKQENYSGVNYANNFPFTTHGMTMPSNFAPHHVMSHMTTQSQMPFYPLPIPYTQANTMYNPPMSHIPNYTQHQIAHMANNGFQPNWNQFHPNQQQVQHHHHHHQTANSSSPPGQLTEEVNQCTELYNQNTTSQATNSNGTPLIKSEPLDDGYKECHLTQL